MASNTISIIIQAKDEASKQIASFTRSIDDSTESAQRSTNAVGSLRDNWLSLAAVAAGAGLAFKGMTSFIGDTVNSAIELQNALLGLSSISKAFGQDAGQAERAARSLASDGLMTVTDAARGLKNLLASGFSLDQATTLMNRFKDSAAFGRQGALSFGDAVASATEGIKNGNSILVDNAGVTKNLSVILEEAGYSAQDLMRATQDGSIRQAIYNGILKETTPMLGDAARLTNSYAGEQAQAAAQTEMLKAKIGESLQPALSNLLAVVTPMIEKFAQFTTDHPGLVAALVLISTAVIGLTALLGTLGLAVAGLGPIFTAMSVVASGSIGVVTSAVSGLWARVAAGGVMGGIVTAGALADIALVMEAVNSVMAAIRDMNNANTAAVNKAKSDTAVINELRRLMKDGTPEQKATATRKMNDMAAAGWFNTKQTYATGTDFAPGGMALVGEQGPEIVNLPRGAQVKTATETSKIMGGVTIQSMNINNNVDVGLVIRQIGWQLATR